MSSGDEESDAQEKTIAKGKGKQKKVETEEEEEEEEEEGEEEEEEEEEEEDVYMKDEDQGIDGEQQEGFAKEYYMKDGEQKVRYIPQKGKPNVVPCDGCLKKNQTCYSQNSSKTRGACYDCGRLKNKCIYTVSFTFQEYIFAFSFKFNRHQNEYGE